MRCRVCDHTSLQPVLDLGHQPWGNHFLREDEVGQEPAYPLRLVHCAHCQTAQLDYTVPKEIMFRDHTYVSGTTTTLRRHFAETACYIDATFFSSRANKSCLDIGSNDGTQLREYQDLGYEVLGVESCARIAERAQADGIPTQHAFFNEEVAKDLEARFDVINASGVFFHLEDLHSVTRGIRTCLKDEGIFVVQFLYMKNIVEITAFDQVYHEHLLYYNVKTIEGLLNRHGLAAFDAYWSTIHGGSIILLATHAQRARKSQRLEQLLTEEDRSKANELETYLAFAERAQQTKERIRRDLDRRKGAGKRLYGLGAPVKGNTLLNYCRMGTETLECLVERNPLRAGMYSPGMHIPIILEDHLERQPDVYFVLAWNFKKEILSRYADLIQRGVEFYFPVQPRKEP